jgi:hypothetical protein
MLSLGQTNPSFGFPSQQPPPMPPPGTVPFGDNAFISTQDAQFFRSQGVTDFSQLSAPQAGDIWANTGTPLTAEEIASANGLGNTTVAGDTFNTFGMMPPPGTVPFGNGVFVSPQDAQFLESQGVTDFSQLSAPQAGDVWANTGTPLTAEEIASANGLGNTAGEAGALDLESIVTALRQLLFGQ